MKITSRKLQLSTAKIELLVLTVREADFRKSTKSRTQKHAGVISLWDTDSFLGGALLQSAKRVAFDAKPGRSELFAFSENANLRAVLLVSWDDKGTAFESVERYRKLGSSCFEAAKRLHCNEAVISSAGLELGNENNLLALCEGLELSGYSFTNYRKKTNDSFAGPKNIIIAGSESVSDKTIALARSFSEATAFARDLINSPPNVCSPSFLVQHARSLAKQGGLKFEVFDRSALKRMGAGALLAVAAGSEEPPFLIKMTYKPKKKAKKIVSLVGKGVTFDSGGLSIKTGAGMETMKMDMSGAAAVMAAMKVVRHLNPDCEIRGYVPTTENMINGRATRPGDVVKAMSGKTIEILNTDAEGRLILADAITLAEKDGCDILVDLATLTGACMVALGTDYAGLFSNDDKLAERLLVAGDMAGEHLWRMPLVKEYKDWIKSPVADIKNLGKPFGGAITAALFLEEFVVKAKWAHLDIAGPAFVDSDMGFIRRGGVGFGVRTLLNFIREL